MSVRNIYNRFSKQVLMLMLYPFGATIVKGAFEPCGVDDNKSIFLEVPAGKLFDITILTSQLA